MQKEKRKGFLVSCLVIIIVVLLLLICAVGISFWFYFSKSKAVTGSQGIPAVYEAVNPISSKQMKNGLFLELMEAEKSEDGLIELHWRYRNPKSKTINLCSNDEGRRIRDSIYLEYDGKKYFPYKFSGGKLISNIGWVDVEPGKSRTFWGKFEVPVKNIQPMVALFIPGITLPFEDIKVAGLPKEKTEKSDKDKKIKKVEPVKKNNFTAMHAAGFVVAVDRVRKSSGDLLEVRWTYYNPTEKGILLCSTDYAKELPKMVHLECDASKQVVAVQKDASGRLSASELPYTVIQPGDGVTVFAKFAIKTEADATMTIYLPNTTPISGLKSGYERNN